MDQILQSILDVAGVSAVLVLDSAGALVSHRGKAIYDRALCEGLAPALVKAADAVELQQSDWDAFSAQFADGKLIVRNLGTVAGRSFILVIVADATLNPSFATVAIRVASNKLKKVLAGASVSSVGSSVLSPSASTAVPLPGAAAPAAAPPPLPPPSDSAVLSGSGVAWSKGSSVGLSRVQAADPASGAFLSRCAKELARHVGPMAKVYVEEAVRRVAGDQPFAMVHGPRLVEDLSGQIEEGEDRAQFRRAVQRG